MGQVRHYIPSIHQNDGELKMKLFLQTLYKGLLVLINGYTMNSMMYKQYTKKE